MSYFCFQYNPSVQFAPLSPPKRYLLKNEKKKKY